ncbi:MAG: hypothetical protein WCI75_00280 [candidate division NC10 bacterium]
MAKTAKNSSGSKTVESLKHDEATRKNVPTAMRPRTPADVTDARILGHGDFVEHNL